jgi:hypothetical protein
MFLTFHTLTGGSKGGTMRLQFVIGYEHIRAGILQDKSNFWWLEEIVDRHHHTPAMQDPKVGRNKLGTILEPQAHPVARSDVKPLS